MPPGPPNALDVALRAGYTQAALHGDHPRRRCRLLAEKYRHELLHPGNREERRRHLVRNETRGRKQLVLLADEEVDPRLSQFLTLHLFMYIVTMQRSSAFDMTPRNRSSLRHPGYAPADRPPRSRPPWLRSSVRTSSASRRTPRPLTRHGFAAGNVVVRGA